MSDRVFHISYLLICTSLLLILAGFILKDEQRTNANQSAINALTGQIQAVHRQLDQQDMTIYTLGAKIELQRQELRYNQP